MLYTCNALWKKNSKCVWVCWDTIKAVSVISKIVETDIGENILWTKECIFMLATVLQYILSCVVVVIIINIRDLLILFQNKTYKINRYQIWYVTILDSNYLIHYPPLADRFIYNICFILRYQLSLMCSNKISKIKYFPP